MNDTANYMAVIERFVNARPGTTCEFTNLATGRCRIEMVHNGLILWRVEEESSARAKEVAAGRCAQALAKLAFEDAKDDPCQLVINTVEAAGWNMEFRMGPTAAWADTLEIRSPDGGMFRRVRGAGLKNCLRRMAEVLKTYPPTPAKETSSDED